MIQRSSVVLVIYILKFSLKKVDERAKECLFLGYDQTRKTVIYGDYSCGKFRAISFKNSDKEGDRGMLAGDGEKVPLNASQELKDGKWKRAMEDEYKSLIDNGV